MNRSTQESPGSRSEQRQEGLEEMGEADRGRGETGRKIRQGHRGDRGEAAQAPSLRHHGALPLDPRRKFRTF